MDIPSPEKLREINEKYRKWTGRKKQVSLPPKTASTSSATLVNLEQKNILTSITSSMEQIEPTSSPSSQLEAHSSSPIETIEKFSSTPMETETLSIKTQTSMDQDDRNDSETEDSETPKPVEKIFTDNQAKLQKFINENFPKDRTPLQYFCHMISSVEDLNIQYDQNDLHYYEVLFNALKADARKESQILCKLLNNSDIDKKIATGLIVPLLLFRNLKKPC